MEFYEASKQGHAALGNVTQTSDLVETKLDELDNPRHVTGGVHARATLDVGTIIATVVGECEVCLHNGRL